MLGADRGPGRTRSARPTHRRDWLYAVAGGDDTSDVAARDTAVLLDDDTTSWSSWNVYAEELAEDTGARAVRISNGGITVPAFFDHVRRCSRPVVNSPKGQTTPLPPDLVQRPVTAPEIYWTWSLVWRENEDRPAVLAVVDALCDGVGDLGIRAPGAWLPDGILTRRGSRPHHLDWEAVPTSREEFGPGQDPVDL